MNRLRSLPVLLDFQSAILNPPTFSRWLFSLNNGMVALPHSFYRATLKHFEQARTLAAYRDHLKGNNKLSINHEQHDQLLNQLIKEKILVQVSGSMRKLP